MNWVNIYAGIKVIGTIIGLVVGTLFIIVLYFLTKGGRDE